jgi:hypothetical protein
LGEFREALNGRRLEVHWIVAMARLNVQRRDLERLNRRNVFGSMLPGV